MEEEIRPRSRQTSTNSTAYSSHSDVWSMNRRAGPSGGGSRASSSTSIWSDEGATIAPPRFHTNGNAGDWDDKDLSMLAEEGERPLIELESNPGEARRGAERVDMGGAAPPDNEEEEGVEEMTPAEKLKALLREMNSEVKETRAVSPVKRMRESQTTEQNRRGKQRDLMDDYSSAAGSDTGATGPGAAGAGAGLGSSTTRRSAWRDRRIGSGGSGSRTTRSESVDGEQQMSAGPSSPRGLPGVNGSYEEEEEDDSPPTPPLRITNPYLYNRKPKRSPTPPVAGDSPRTEERRIPTRVEVLHASESFTASYGGTDAEC